MQQRGLLGIEELNTGQIQQILDRSRFYQPLETRTAPATFMVTTLSDSGVGSLRAAMALANGMAGADTIDQMVHNSGALESPFWSYLYKNGFGYLDAQRVGYDGSIACANRKAGVPPYQVIPLLESRGYTAGEAQGIVLAEESASESQAFPVC